MKDFRGKVAAITGAGSGIGRALALQLAREGAQLALSDVDPQGLADTASKFAVRGYTEALRMEMELGASPVSATCVHPGGISTRIAKSMRVDDGLLRAAGLDAESFRERSNRLLQVTTPEQAAQRILAGVKRNARRVLVGPDAHALQVMESVLGAGYLPLLVRRWRQMAAAR